MVGWRRFTEVTSIAAGVTAAAVGAAVAVEKVAVGRIRLRPDPAADEPLGGLHGQELTVLADDGVALHAEIDGPVESPVTVIFSHGFTLNQNSWHYQRRDLDGYRLVFWDHRSHGRSGRSAPANENIDQLGHDLYAVIQATAPGQIPVVLAGHSMGGMTIMALAEQHPELFGTKVVGVVLIATSASGLSDMTLGLPGPLGAAARRAVPKALRSAGKRGRAFLVERARHAGGDLAFLGTRFIAFGDKGTSPALTDFLEQMIRATPVEVVSQFFGSLLIHDKMVCLPTMGKVPTVVIAAGKDRLTPWQRGQEIADCVPGAELVVHPTAGHAIMLECPDLVTAQPAWPKPWVRMAPVRTRKPP
jgi:pimeloyl-ACP methyl ester carboxylesterase